MGFKESLKLEIIWLYSFQLVQVLLILDVNDSPYNSDNTNVQDDIESLVPCFCIIVKASFIEFDNSVELWKVGVNVGNDVGTFDGWLLGFDEGWLEGWLEGWPVG